MIIIQILTLMISRDWVNSPKAGKGLLNRVVLANGPGGSVIKGERFMNGILRKVSLRDIVRVVVST